MKKYILPILMLSLLVSCNGSEDIFIPEENLPIESSDVTFPAIGGTGSIKLSNVSVSSAESSTDWCTVSSCSNGVVEFSVQPNPSLEERISLISVKAENSQGVVAITQIGLRIDNDPSASFCYGNNVAFDRFVKFSSTLDVNVKSGAGSDWLAYKLVDGGIEFFAAANGTGKFRHASVNVSSGQVSCDYQFIQFGVDDVVGSWNMKADDANAIPVSDIVNVSKAEDGSLLMNFVESGYNGIKASIKNNALAIDCGQTIPTVNSTLPYDFIIGVYPLGENNIGITPNVYYQLTPAVTADGKLEFCFSDNGMLGTPVKSFAVWACDPASKAVAGYWDLLYDICLSR